MLKWIDSLGGPLVAVPERQLANWQGVDLENTGDPSDYDRACAVADEVGIIQCGGEDVLVLGDDPNSTAWKPLDNGGLLVRWFYADSEDSVLAVLEQDLSAKLADTPVKLVVNGPYQLIDAADAGSKLTQGSIRMLLLPGVYRIRTGTVDAGPEVRLVIHHLSRE